MIVNEWGPDPDNPDGPNILLRSYDDGTTDVGDGVAPALTVQDIAAQMAALQAQLAAIMAQGGSQ